MSYLADDLDRPTLGDDPDVRRCLRGEALPERSSPALFPFHQVAAALSRHGMIDLLKPRPHTVAIPSIREIVNV